MFIYLFLPKDSFKISPHGFKDRSKRTLFSSPAYYSVLEVFIKILLLVIVLLPFRDRSPSVLQALQLAWPTFLLEISLSVRIDVFALKRGFSAIASRAFGAQSVRHHYARQFRSLVPNPLSKRFLGFIAS